MTFLVCLLGWCHGLAVCGADAPPRTPNADQPFFEYRQHQTAYEGPGRELPAPQDVQEVRLAYFGPTDPTDAHGGELWAAAQLAIEEANAERGFQGKPFRLLAAWSDNPWTGGVTRLTELVYRDGVWAVLGGIDGPSTHLAEQVVAKTRLPLISPVSTDKTVNLTNVPWMFSLAPGDHLIAPLLASALIARLGDGDFVRISATDHDSRLLAKEIEKDLSRRHRTAKYQFESRGGERELATLLPRVLQAAPAAVLLIGGPDDSARWVNALRGGGFRGAIVGGPALGRQRFLTSTGAAAEGLVFPLLCEPAALRCEFASAYARRAGVPCDHASVQTYDAVRLLVAAIRQAGLNRARIRDALADLAPWTGQAGRVAWDRTGSNVRPPILGTVQDGRVASADADPATPP